MTGRTVASEARTQFLHTHTYDGRVHAILSLSSSVSTCLAPCVRFSSISLHVFVVITITRYSKFVIIATIMHKVVLFKLSLD